MKRHIILTEAESITLGQLENRLREARAQGFEDDAPLVSWYDPGYLVGRLVFEDRQPVTDLSNEELLTRFRSGDLGGYGAQELWDEIAARLRATEA